MWHYFIHCWTLSINLCLKYYFRLNLRDGTYLIQILFSGCKNYCWGQSAWEGSTIRISDDDRTQAIPSRVSSSSLRSQGQRDILCRWSSEPRNQRQVPHSAPTERSSSRRLRRHNCEVPTLSHLYSEPC